MKLRVGIGATVFEDSELVIEVGGVPQSRKHHAARGYPGEHQFLDAQRPQENIEITARKGADPSLGDDDVVTSRSNGRMNLGIRMIIHHVSRIGESAERPISRAHL